MPSSETSSAPAPTAPARRAPAPDAVAAAAVELARAAAVELAGERAVGEHVGVQADDERVVTHRFVCADLAYRGWHWSVTLARAPRAKVPTVDEVLLLPGEDALLAPAWLPWSERLRPGDLGVGDLLPTAADDLRLVPGYVPLEQDDEELLGSSGFWELGLGRERVLSRLGRDAAADRWHSGEAGPTAPIAEVAPAQCASCGFFALLAGSLGASFGVCANEYAPDDGRVVSVDHGCGAHSEVAVMPPAGALAPIIDDLGYDIFEVDGRAGAAREQAQAPAPDETPGGDDTAVPDAESPTGGGGASGNPDAGSVTPDEPAEELGHS